MHALRRAALLGAEDAVAVDVDAPLTQAHDDADASLVAAAADPLAAPRTRRTLHGPRADALARG